MSNDIALIHATVRDYVEGIRDTDIARVESAFHPDAVMTGHFDGQFSIIPHAGQFIGEYMRKLPPTSEHSPTYEGVVIGMDHFDTLARVTLEENGLEGVDMRAVLTLHKVDGRWVILSKGGWAPN